MERKRGAEDDLVAPDAPALRTDAAQLAALAQQNAALQHEQEWLALELRAMRECDTPDARTLLLASEWSASWLCARNAIGSCNRDVGSIVRAHVLTPTIFVTGVTSSLPGTIMPTNVNWALSLDKHSQTWRNELPPPCAMYNHTCVVNHDQQMMVMGGRCASLRFSTDDKYALHVAVYRRAGGGVWSETVSPTRGHAATAAAVAYADAVYECGGQRAQSSFQLMANAAHTLFSGDVAPRAERRLPSSMIVTRDNGRTWTDAAPMHFHREGHALAVVDRSALVAMGGAHDTLPHERYLPETNTWFRFQHDSAAHVGAHASRGARAITLDRTVVLCGGQSRLHNICSDVTWRLDVRIDTFLVLATMPTPTAWHAACALDDHTVVVTGGHHDPSAAWWCADASVYDDRADRWCVEPRWRLPTGTCRHTMAVVRS